MNLILDASKLKVRLGILFLCCLLCFFSSCESGNLEIRFVSTFQQQFNQVDSVTLVISGPVVEEKQTVSGSFATGSLAFPDVVLKEESEEKWLEIEVTGSDKENNLLSYGKTRFRISDPKATIQLNVLLSRVGRMGWLTKTSNRSKSLFFDSLFGYGVSLLPSGKILVSGGVSEVVETKGHIFFDAAAKTSDSLQVLDPTTGEFSNLVSLGISRAFHSSTKLLDGTVLLAGGIGKINNQFTTIRPLLVYNEATNSLKTLSSSFDTPRYFHTASILPSGKVLFVGGLAGALNQSKDPIDIAGQTIGRIEIFDHKSQSLSQVAALPAELSRFFHQSTVLNEDTVLISGGLYFDGQANTFETALKVPKNVLLTKKEGTWTHKELLLPTNTFGRFNHASLLISSGDQSRVLVSGGRTTENKALSSLEIWDAEGTGKKVQVDLKKARYGHKMFLLGANQVFIIGGLDSDQKAVLECEVLIFSVEAGEFAFEHKEVPDCKLLESNGRFLAEGAFDSLSKRLYLLGGGRKETTTNRLRGQNSIEFFTQLISVGANQ